LLLSAADERKAFASSLALMTHTAFQYFKPVSEFRSVYDEGLGIRNYTDE